MMHKEEDIGLEVPENQEELVWMRVRTNAEREIQASKDAILVNEGLLELAEQRLAELNVKQNTDGS